jgi:cytochrome c
MRGINPSICATVLVLAVVVSSLVHPWGNLRNVSPVGGPILAGSNVPNEARSVVSQKCGDCHSNNTRWPFYSRIAPASWLVEHDVHEGREHLNLSAWEQYSIDNRIDLLGKMGTQLRQGKMPLPQYLLMHPEARLSDAERKLILDWTKVERKGLMTEAAK